MKITVPKVVFTSDSFDPAMFTGYYTSEDKFIYPMTGCPPSEMEMKLTKLDICLFTEGASEYPKGPIGQAPHLHLVFYGEKWFNLADLFPFT